MVNWDSYLTSICQTYQRWWADYTLTDVVGQQKAEPTPPELLPLDLGLMSFDLGLMVETVQPPQEEPRGERHPEREKTERLGVLDGLRKYAPAHVLLVGRPGSGKSTALARLLLEVAGGDRSHIPILVELRYYQTSVLDLIRDFLKRHRLLLDRNEIETLLFDGQVLLLLDGLNELPSAEARRAVNAFRQAYPKTPMIATTRDLGIGGDLDIEKKLEMQPLTEPQMRQFVTAYLPGQADAMLRQLGSRLREFGQTPLLLWMLCSLFRSVGQVPSNLGLVFHQFTESYDRKLKQDIPVSDEFRRWRPHLLQQLAWRMTQGKKPTDIQVAIPRGQAEDILTEFLQDKVAYPEDCAIAWLTQLLNHHLIQPGANHQIEFRHQLIQEYYAAEALLNQLPTLTDDGLKRDYLNYLKWTEPIALMLGLVMDEKIALHMVELAIDVDLQLGARLVGCVLPRFQGGAIELLEGRSFPQRLQVELWSKTRSEAAIPGLLKALEDQDFFVRWSAVSALEQLHSEAALPGLLKALEDQNSDVRWSAVSALEQLHSEAALPGLLQALEHQDSDVRWSAVSALGKLQSETALPGLLQALERQDFDVRWSAADALGKLQSETAISGLLKALEDQDSDVLESAADALGQLQSEAAIPGLLKALKHQDSDVRWSAADALATLDNPCVLPSLNKLVLHSHTDLLSTVTAIQDRCQFYNYEMAQSLPPKSSEAENFNSPTQGLTIVTDKQPVINFHQPNATVGVNYASEGSTIKFQQNVKNVTEQDLAKAVQQIQALLNQLAQTYPTTTESQQQTFIQRFLERVESTPNLVKVMLAGGIEGVKLLCPPAGVPIEMLRRLYEAIQEQYGQQQEEQS